MSAKIGKLKELVSDQANYPHSKQIKGESDIAGAQGAQAGAQGLSREQSTILSFCKKPRSRSEILTKIGLTNHRKNYLRHIVPLMDKSLVEMTIPETPTHMHQKYVLTEKGRAHILKHKPI